MRILAILAAGSLVAGCGSGKSPAGSAATPSASSSPKVAAETKNDPQGGPAGGLAAATGNEALQPAPSAPAASGGGGGGRSTGPQRAPSVSREAYLAQTRAAREKGLALAVAQQKLKEEAAEKARAGEVVYQGPAANIPKELLGKPGVRVEVRKDRPGEVTLRRLSAQ